MDKYHIYEEIGKGGCSQVFKGREKKKIEYVAIKRVDKSSMPRTVNEVQIMHKLQNPHILRFFDWYETKNNLWLILEYCTGADLQSLLSQDHHLPEASIKIFALDILSGLKYMHGLGILHCDIRPKNFLVDEHGIVKFSNFKYARKISKSIAALEPIESKGFPPYMASELFSVEGVNSYSSDFWSFGCILYVFRRGSLPWPDDSSVEYLAAKVPFSNFFEVSNDENFPTMSAELVDLVSWLTEKSPYNRCSWEDLCAHPFWASNSIAPPKTLPPNPSYDNYVKKYEKIEIERLENEAIIEAGQDNSYNSNEHPHLSKSEATPVRPIFRNSRLESIRDEKTSPQFKPSNFESHNESVNDTKPNSTRHIVPHFHPELSIFTTLTTQSNKIQKFSVDDLVYHATDLTVKPIIGNKFIESIDKFSFKQPLPFEPLSLSEVASSSQNELETHLTSVYKAIHRCTNNISTTSALNMTTSISPSPVLSSLLNLLGYLGTISVSPEVSNIVLNTSFLSLLLKLLRINIAGNQQSKSNRYGGNQSPTLPKFHSNSYSNVLVMTKISIVTILGTMLRYATFVIPPNEKSKQDHIIPLLLEQLDLENTDIRLYRRVAAAFGEMVFYVTAQDDSDSGKAGKKSDSNSWDTSQVHDGLIRCLDLNDEIVQHYAAKAVENILAQGNSDFREQLVTQTLAARLLKLLMESTSENFQATCATALGHMFERSCTKSKLLNVVTSVLQVSTIPKFIEMIKNGTPRIQTPCLNIINLIFMNTEDFDSGLLPHRELIVNSSSAVAIFSRIIEMSNSSVLRAKSLLAVLLLCRYSRPTLNKICETRLPAVLSRILESSKVSLAVRSNNADQAISTYLLDVTLSFTAIFRSVSLNCILSIESAIKNVMNDARKIDEENDQLKRKAINVMTQNANTLSSVISMISSQGTLRRVFFASDAIKFCGSLVQTLVAFEKYKANDLPSVAGIDHSLLLCVEALAKIDFEERLEEDDFNVNYELEFLKVISLAVYPILINYTSSKNPETRVVILSCIRSMLPSFMKALTTLSNSKKINSSREIRTPLECLFQSIPSMMNDFSPIPQYAKKLVGDLLDMSEIQPIVQSLLQTLSSDTRNALET